MDFDLSFRIILVLTSTVLLSPLLLLTSPFVVIFLIVSIPLFLLNFYRYFSLHRSQSSTHQFRHITIAHRGGHPLVPSGTTDEFPENTLAAYRWASTMEGVDGIELDIWLSADNIPMVNHDGFLGHTFADCNEFISNLTCEQLKQLKYWKKDKRNRYDQLGCEIIPTLEEVIRFLEPTRLKLSTLIPSRTIDHICVLLVIEIKETRKISEMATILDDLFKRYPFLYERAFCAAFHPYNLYALRRRNARISTAFLFAPDLTSYMIFNASQTPRPLPTYFTHNLLLRWIIDSLSLWFGTPAGLQFLGADLACIEHGQVSQNLLEQYKKAQLVICAWCVNEPEQRRWLKANGVTIITDTLFDLGE